MLEHCQLTGHQLPTLGFLPFSSLGVVHGDLEDVTDGDQAGVSGDVTELVCGVTELSRPHSALAEK